jgi:4,5-dihydroxyphthalate decarboxylase
MTINIAAPNEFASHYIADGTVKIEGFDVTLGWKNGAAAYASAFTDLAYDVSVLPLSNFLIAMDQGHPVVGIPVFIDLFFPQMAIRVNKAAGIKTPKDLEGKKVGVRGFGFNPAVWVRGGLADVYGFDFTKVDWKSAEPNSMSHVDIPTLPGVTIKKGTFDFVADLESGKLDAVMWDRGGVDVTANTANLFEDPLAEVQTYFKQTGVFPLNSMLLAKRDVLDANPGLGQAIVDASTKAQSLFFENLADDTGYMGMPVKWLRENGMMPYRNGIANNRTALETIIRYANEQGLISKRPAVEDLFFTGAA